MHLSNRCCNYKSKVLIVSNKNILSYANCSTLDVQRYIMPFLFCMIDFILYRLLDILEF